MGLKAHGGAFGVAAITGGTVKVDDGTVGAPSYSFANALTSGMYLAVANSPGISASGVLKINWDSNGTLLNSNVYLVGNANQLQIGTGAAAQSIKRFGGLAGYVEWGSVTENLTLSIAGATTDTAADLLPANSYIESVTARITTTITTATDWKLGDATTSGRFTAANATMTSGTTSVGLVHCDVTGAGGPRQTAAAKVRVTTTGTPGAGAIRLTSYYRTFVAPTS